MTCVEFFLSKITVQIYVHSKKDKYRRKGKGHSCCLGNRIYAQGRFWRIGCMHHILQIILVQLIHHAWCVFPHDSIKYQSFYGFFYNIIYTVLQCDLPPLRPHCGEAPAVLGTASQREKPINVLLILSNPDSLHLGPQDERLLRLSVLPPYYLI